jgi:hypothetical protein
MAEIAGREFIVFENRSVSGKDPDIDMRNFLSQMPFDTGHGINRNLFRQKSAGVFMSRRVAAVLPPLRMYPSGGVHTAQFGNSGFTVDLISPGLIYGLPVRMSSPTIPTIHGVFRTSFSVFCARTETVNSWFIVTIILRINRFMHH